jgi:tetratricopeptide (TPR) repeat protein
MRSGRYVKVMPFTTGRILIFLFFIVNSFSSMLTAQLNREDSIRFMINQENLNIYDPSHFLRNVISDSKLLQDLESEFKTQENYISLSYIYNLLGKNALNATNYPLALEYHKKAYALSLEADNELLKITSLNMLGVVYRRKSAIRSAMDCYSKALNIASRKNPQNKQRIKGIAVANQGIGSIRGQLKQYKKAISYYKLALESEKKLESDLGIAIDNHCIGDAYEMMGLLDSALLYHNQSLIYNKKINSDFGKSICYNSISQIYLRKGMPEIASLYLKPAMKLAKAVGDSSYIVTSQLNMAWYLNQTGQLDSSLYYLDNGTGIAKRTGNQSHLLHAYDLYYELYSKKGNQSQAFNYYKKSRQLNDQIVSQENQQYIADLTILYDTEKKQNRIEQLTLESVMAGKVQKAQYVMIVLLLLLALSLGFFFWQKIQVSNKNKEIHKHKENLYNMRLEVEKLNNQRLAAENEQTESEKMILTNQLKVSKTLRNHEREQLEQKIAHKNRELAITAAVTINKSETLHRLLQVMKKFEIKDNGNSQKLASLKTEIENQLNPVNDWDSFRIHFESVHPDFFKTLKNQYSSLTTHDLRLSAYVLMNLSNKEIALLLSVSQEAVQKAKYRLKKKFSLNGNESLFDFLLSIN